jgi:hypothetical protein
VLLPVISKRSPFRLISVDLRRVSLSALRRPWGNRPSTACLGATRVLATFQVGHQHPSVYSIALCHTGPSTVIARQVGCDTVVALCAKLWPATIFTAGVLNTIILSAAAAAIYRPTGARAAAAFLKRPRQKVPHYCLTRINHLMHTHRRQVYTVYLLPLGTLFFSSFILISFVPY